MIVDILAESVDRSGVRFPPSTSDVVFSAMLFIVAYTISQVCTAETAIGCCGSMVGEMDSHCSMTALQSV